MNGSATDALDLDGSGAAVDSNGNGRDDAEYGLLSST